MMRKLPNPSWLCSATWLIGIIHHEVAGFYERKSPGVHCKCSAAERHVKMGYDYDPLQSCRNTHHHLSSLLANLPFFSVSNDLLWRVDLGYRSRSDDSLELAEA